MRLIDADVFKTEYDNLITWVSHRVEKVRLREFIRDIQNQPTVKAIPIEWMKNKREELEKEYYNLFQAYTDDSRNNQVQLLNDFHAFNTVLRYWEKENEPQSRNN